MLTLISFASLILSSYGASKFVIDSYSIPDPDNIGGSLSQTAAYPLDVCVSYQVSLNGLSIQNYYGIYSCNQVGDEVTLTDYGQDDTCTTADGTNDKVISYNSQLAAGDLLTFNCDGESNYVQVTAYTFFGDKSGQSEGYGLCCGSETPFSVAVTTSATDVCVATDIDGQGTTGYTKGSCDDTGSEILIYTDNTCTTPTGATADTASATSCGLFSSGTVSLYRLQTNCVLNGVETNPVTDYCDSLPTEEPTTAEPTTAEPTPSGEGTPDPTTAEPTTSEPTTSQPTAAPTTSEPTTSEPTTAEPTAVTASPTTAEPTTAEPTEVPAQDEAKGCIFVINYVVLLVLGMAIFVN